MTGINKTNCYSEINIDKTPSNSLKKNKSEDKIEDNKFVKFIPQKSDTIKFKITDKESGQAITEIKIIPEPEAKSEIEKGIESLTSFGDVSLESVSLPIKNIGTIIKPLEPFLEKQDEISVKVKVQFD